MRISIAKALLAGTLLMTVAGCATSNYPSMTVAQANSMLPQSYGLAPGDAVRINVFDEPGLSGEYEVGSNGAIAFPLIAEVPASGRSATELAEQIATELSVNGFVQQPRVAAEIVTYRPVYILGEVQSPGEFEYTGDLTILQAVAKAGGFTPLADERNVLLTRRGDDQTVLVRLGQTPLKIAPGDTVMIRPSAF